jgi:catechol 2,3-dioxygenase-like lactoylglutathione lyase family enzyme
MLSNQEPCVTRESEGYNNTNKRESLMEMTGFSFRYIVNNVDKAIVFYRNHLGFGVEMHPNNHFAIPSRDHFRLMLNTPTGPGGDAQSMPDGSTPEPGGWNRIQIQVRNLIKEVENLRKSGLHFRSDIITGIGAKQIILDDPSGNPIELHELLPK